MCGKEIISQRRLVVNRVSSNEPDKEEEDEKCVDGSAVVECQMLI